MDTKVLKLAGIALGAYALVAFIQTKYAIPVIGAYLPKA